jgi:hypothetical protein
MKVPERRARKKTASLEARIAIAEERDVAFWKEHRLSRDKNDQKTARLKALRLAKK